MTEKETLKELRELGNSYIHPTLLENIDLLNSTDELTKDMIKNNDQEINNSQNKDKG